MSIKVFPTIDALIKAKLYIQSPNEKLTSYEEKVLAKLIGVSVNCDPKDRCEFNWHRDYDMRDMPNEHFRCSLPKGHNEDHACYNIDDPADTHDIDCDHYCCTEPISLKKKRF